MTTLNRFGCFLIISCVLFCLLATTPTLAQTRKAADSPEAETATKELIAEVRLMRVALEQNQKLLMRLLSVTERLRVQHEIVLQLSRDLEDTRRQISDMNFDPAQAADSLANMEKRVSVGVVDGGKLQQLKTEVDQRMQRDRELRDRESSVLSQLKTERARLGDLSQQLEALEREILR